MFQELQYTGEQSMIADSTSKMAKKYDNLYFLSTTKNNQFPDEFWGELAEGGYLGAMVEVKNGGSGFSTQDLAVFIHRMALQGLASYHLLDQMLCADILSQYASETQKALYLPKIMAGEHWSYAYLEQPNGRSLFDFSLSASADGDTYTLNGKKAYVLAAKSASHLIVAARTQPLDESQPENGISLFIVDPGTPGISMSCAHVNVRVTEDREEMSVTGDTFYYVDFSDVRVPAQNLIGKANEGGCYLKKIGCRSLLFTALMTTGWSDRMIEKTVDYANQRTIYKDPIGSYQAVQHPVVLAKTDVEMAKLLIERAVEVFDATEDLEELLNYCGVAKYYACEAAQSSFDVSFQAHGGSGYDRDTGIIGLWPLALLARMLPLNPEAILEKFAEDVLGLPTS